MTWREVGAYTSWDQADSVRILKSDADTFLAARRVTCAADARRLADGRRRS